jgi:hypothetical protein
MIKTPPQDNPVAVVIGGEDRFAAWQVEASTTSCLSVDSPGTR